MNQKNDFKSAIVLGVQVEPLNMESALSRVAEVLKSHSKGYACLIGVHGIMEAQRDPGLAKIYARAALKIPDGTPAVWVGRFQGFSLMEQVTGPDLMWEIFQRKEFSEFTHFLYGGKEGVAEELRSRLEFEFPWARVIGTYTPPFRDLTLEEDAQFIARIRELKPDIIWVGISTPKQERFMARLLPLLHTTIMFGVGAAFDFHTGRIKDSPRWVKRAGLQWMHRLIQDPRRLLWRYLRNNPSFLWHIALQLLGLRTYPPVKLDAGLPARPQVVSGR